MNELQKTTTPDGTETPLNARAMKVLMFTITEPVANALFGVSNILLIMGAVAVLVGTIGVAVMGSAKEQFSNERISENEAATQQAVAKAATATAEAASANLELAKLKTPRRLTAGQALEITATVRHFTNIRFDMSVVSGDTLDDLPLVGQIAAALENGGWKWIEWNHPNGPFMNVYQFPNLPNIGQGGGVRSGIGILIRSDHATVFNAAANALSKALTNVSMVNDVGAAATSDIPNHDTIHIVIGKKPI